MKMMISIHVNDSETQVAKQSTLATLMSNLHQNSTGMAVAINNRVIPKSQWSETGLEQNDQVLVITATQGG